MKSGRNQVIMTNDLENVFTKLSKADKQAKYNRAPASFIGNPTLKCITHPDVSPGQITNSPHGLRECQ